MFWLKLSGYFYKERQWVTFSDAGEMNYRNWLINYTRRDDRSIWTASLSYLTTRIYSWWIDYVCFWCGHQLLSADTLRVSPYDILLRYNFVTIPPSYDTSLLRYNFVTIPPSYDSTLFLGGINHNRCRVSKFSITIYLFTLLCGI